MNKKYQINFLSASLVKARKEYMQKHGLNAQDVPLITTSLMENAGNDVACSATSRNEVQAIVIISD